MSAPAVFLIVCSGMVGLIVGSFLNVVISRVPPGTSELRPRQCPSCNARVGLWQSVPVISWVALRGRCANCGARISARSPLVELTAGVAFAGLAWWAVVDLTSGPNVSGSPEIWPVLAAYQYLAAISIALTMIDIRTRRLPNAIVLPSYAVLAGLLAFACLLGAPWSALLRAAIGGVSLFVFYVLLRAAKPGGMGGGDVKLAGVLGAALGWIGWGALVVGAFAAFLVGGVVGLLLMASGRATRTSAIPFGPYMVIGAWIGILWGEVTAQWYLGMLVTQPGQ